ncbi:hypothetical protein C2G38_2181216 [Gigaspora rosea]|uniref:Uncharacterized protein n=1 Tax=Gigaspora rosea TaxID=44941 RepID=A0A397VCD3_9GLOM|nr:hypothetical protein C2G38_2181216 [Gigaspora rosea]
MKSLYEALFNFKDDFNQEFDVDVEQEEIEIPVFLNSGITTKAMCCPIINNNDKPNIIQRCSRIAKIYINQLFGTWKINSLAIQEIGNNISKLRIYMNYFNYNYKTVHEGGIKRAYPFNKRMFIGSKLLNHFDNSALNITDIDKISSYEM